MWLLACVSKHVRIQISYLHKWSLTDFAFVWLRACVSEHVRLQMYNLHKWFLAYFAFVWLLLSVGDPDHVPLQVSRFGKWLLTDLTPGPSVYKLMSLEMLRSGEGLVALFALEWLCSSMSELMCLEISVLVEGLIALSALVRPLCGNTIVWFLSSVG